MCPITHMSYLAIVVSVVASFVFGFLWYGPLFGKRWAQLAGIKMDKDSMGKPPVTSLLMTLAGNCATVFVLAYIIGNGKFPCYWDAALKVWVGFYVPLMLGTVAWEGRPWGFFGINAAYTFLNLQLIAAILMYVK